MHVTAVELSVVHKSRHCALQQAPVQDDTLPGKKQALNEQWQVPGRVYVFNKMLCT